MLRTMALVAVAAGATGAGVGIADLRDSYVTVAGTFSATWYVDISLDGTNYVAFDSGTAAKAVGPIPLPTKRKIYCVLRSPHVDKDSREHFETRTHRRVVDIYQPSSKTIDALMKLDLPAGVDIEVKL